MRQKEIAKKYSQALFELGKEDNRLLDYKEQFANIVMTIEKYNDLRRLLFHPGVMPVDKKKMIEDIFSSSISEEIINLLKFLIDKRRLKYIVAIYNDFIDLLNKENRILEVEVISAVKLSNSSKDKLKKRLVNLSGYKFLLKEVINPDIIGGLILKIGDQVIDGSIRHDLELLSDKIAEIPVSELGV